jgi:PQQ-dependent dehydrogenase (s-GDH family)
VGFRNAQGLAFTPSGLLYGTDQGPKSDDEVNLLRPGKNYGWPHVAGYRDDKAYVYAQWAKAKNGCESETFNDYDIPLDVPYLKETDWNDPDFTPPLITFDTVEDDFNFRADADCVNPATEFVCWPTLALSSLEAGPSGTLLATSLKDGAVYRIPLTSGGEKAGTATRIADTVNRYRDTALDPTGKTLYIATDSAGYTRDEGDSPTPVLKNPGAILAYEL